MQKCANDVPRVPALTVGSVTLCAYVWSQSDFVPKVQLGRGSGEWNVAV
jgi:hypothetical protein